jgi:hypothetical protein
MGNVIMYIRIEIQEDKRKNAHLENYLYCYAYCTFLIFFSLLGFRLLSS